MPLDILYRLAISLFDILRGTISIFLPIFLLVIIGKWLRSKISEKTKWKWLPSALISTFIILWIIILLVYFFPFLTSLQELDVGEVPSIYAPSSASIALSYLYGLLRVTISVLVITLILMPFEFIGLYIFDSVKKKFPKNPELLNIAVTCYIAGAVSAAIFLFIIPQAVTGLLYFIFFGV